MDGVTRKKRHTRTTRDVLDRSPGLLLPAKFDDALGTVVFCSSAALRVDLALHMHKKSVADHQSALRADGPSPSPAAGGFYNTIHYRQWIRQAKLGHLDLGVSRWAASMSVETPA